MAGRAPVAAMLLLVLYVEEGQAAISIACGNCTFHVSDEGLLSREGSCEEDCSFLSLPNRGIRDITVGAFDGMSSLLEIQLSYNQLTVLPAGLFNRLSNMYYLLLDHNQLSTLPPGIFDNQLTNLMFLFLDNNQLNELPAGVFDNLSNLYGLYLSNNQLSTLPTGIFDKLSSLFTLHLDYNQFATLPAGIFDKTSNLGSLLLSYNQLTTLPAGIFDKLSGLSYLLLDNNQLVCMLPQTFANLTVLSYLDILRNNLTCAYDAWPLLALLDSGLQNCSADFLCHVTPPPMAWQPWPAKELEGISACNETRSWEELINGREEETGRMKTGGLGVRMAEAEVEVWACFKNDACLLALSAGGQDWICYVYREMRREWVVWGLNSELNLV
eukprot:764802-Hanusia_phi.AAC.2